jgi:hypothetical protein
MKFRLKFPLLGGHTNCVSALTMTHDGYLISGSYDTNIKVAKLSF